MAGKEKAGNDGGKRITRGGAPDSSHGDRLHIVVVVCAAGVAGLQGVVDIAGESGESANETKDTVVG